MIQNDAVITTDNAFVVADKINKQQWVRSFNENTVLLEVVDDEEVGVLVETEHFFIIVCPHQRFIVSEVECKQAQNLTKTDQVLTADGFQQVTGKTNLGTMYYMTNLKTKSGLYVANSFYLLSD